MRREEINIEKKQKRTHMVVDIGKLIKWIYSMTATKSSIRHTSNIASRNPHMIGLPCIIVIHGRQRDLVHLR